MAEDLARRIDRLETRAALAELGSSYCIACDDRDMTRLAALFTDDIHIRSQDGTMNACGCEAVMAMFEQMFAIRGPAFHWTHDRIVNFDEADPDRATGLVLAHAETTPHGKASIAAIRYQDRYRRVAGRWLFAERVLSFLYYMPVADYVARLPTPLRMGIGGTWRAADFPESLVTWPARTLAQTTPGNAGVTERSPG